MNTKTPNWHPRVPAYRQKSSLSSHIPSNLRSDTPRNLKKNAIWRRCASSEDELEIEGSEDSFPSYKYTSMEIDELAAMMPARLDAPLQSRSKRVLQKILEKHGLVVNTLFMDEVGGDGSSGGTAFPDLPSWLSEKKPLKTSKRKAKEMDETEDQRLRRENFEACVSLSVPDEMGFALPLGDPESLELWVENIENGFEARQQWELHQVFEKAMELHHKQNTRANNIYSATMWFARVLEQVETGDEFEGGEVMIIPPFVRAIFILEENFDELNKRQDALDKKASERSKRQEEALFYSWVEENVDVSVPLSPPKHTVKRQPQPVLEEESSALSIDDLLHGIIPNAEEEEGEEIYSDVVKDLLEGGSGDLNFRKVTPTESFEVPQIEGMDDGTT